MQATNCNQRKKKKEKKKRNLAEDLRDGVGQKITHKCQGLARSLPRLGAAPTELAGGSMGPQSQVVELLLEAIRPQGTSE